MFVEKNLPQGMLFFCLIDLTNAYNSAYLSRHARIHSNSRPYACSMPGCSATFKRSDHAKAHEKAHGKKIADTNVQLMEGIPETLNTMDISNM